MKPSFLFFTALFWVSCSNTPQQQTETPAPAAGETVMNDSLRAVFTQKIAAVKEPMPLHQFKEAGKLHPVDQAPKDSLFFLFRAGLIDMVSRKDVISLMKQVHPEIKYSFGDPEGIAGFVKSWGLTSPEEAQKSEIWNVLERILPMGGVFTAPDEFVAPYYFSTWPEDTDAFGYLAVTGGGVRLRETASLNSRIVKTISYDMVKLTGQSDTQETINGHTHPWFKVKMADGTEGFIFGQFLGSPVGYRAGFRKTPGQGWKLVFLVAGD